MSPNWNKVFLNETPAIVDRATVHEEGFYLILYQGQIVNDSKYLVEMGIQLWINGVKTKA